MTDEVLKLKELILQLENDNKRLVAENKELKALAYIDHLTGLHNRRAIAELDVDNMYGTVIMMDIDDFKNFNDTYGHNHGDEILLFVSEILKSNSRTGDLCIRWGGEEFLIFYKNCGSNDVLEKIKTISNQLAYISNCKFLIPITASFGITEYHSGDIFKDVVEKADIALYESKNSGKNTINIYDESMNKNKNRSKL